MKEKYDFKQLEKKWRPVWEEIDLYKTGTDPNKPRYYILDFFPYPSGDGLSVGHCRNYVPTCVMARFKRMQGYNVLHPMGWDAFGLPAENYAIAKGINPRITTKQHADTYRRQMKLVECSYDWSKEFSSTDPTYYRWTQWFFLLLHQRGLAYQAVGSQWWCPTDKTILANEQVVNGRCWRCDSIVTKKDLKQWYLRITDYADRLIDDLDGLDWPDSIKSMQRNWIGRSEGVEISFEIVKDHKPNGGYSDTITTFTTRPDTIFGATFLALAPEHPLVNDLVTPSQRPAVDDYLKNVSAKKANDWHAAGIQESGVFTGSYVRHPFTEEDVPVYVAEYVLMEYGHGAIMGVPGHDQRDYQFATEHGLPIVQVVGPAAPDEETQLPYIEPGTLINSGGYSGGSSAAGGQDIVNALIEMNLGSRTVTYKMRDWLISRQRYWGAPIPIIHCQECGSIPVPEEDLPVLLPEIDDYAPSDDGRSPLSKVSEWVNVSCPKCSGPAKRETDTMDGFACSSWYFLRFPNPEYGEGPFDPADEEYWLPVDTYVGGAEHAVMHLLYSRFWTKVMADAELISFDEPFTQLRNQGVLHASGGLRMSKSAGNVVTPDEVVAEHGSDALRTYILFIGPFDGDVTWDSSNIVGVDRFLDRYWKLAQLFEAGQLGVESGEIDQARDYDLERKNHILIKGVTNDLERYKFNTAVASLMAHLNLLYSQIEVPLSVDAWHRSLEIFTRLISPIAPFISEEIWQESLNHKGTSVHTLDWLTYDDNLALPEEVAIMIQINGKLRDQVVVSPDFSEDALVEAALAQPNIQRHLASQQISRTVIVPAKLINFVTVQPELKLGPNCPPPGSMVKSGRF